MQLPTQKQPPERRNPKLLTIFGQSKVGKTTALAALDDCLIIDTEEGADLIEALKVRVNNLKEFNDMLMAILDSEHKYTYVALDTLDNVVFWLEAATCKEHGVKQIGDIPFGGGYSEVRDKVMLYINRLKQICTHVIIVGHRKKTIIGTETVEVNTSSLDLSGKLKNFVMADSDAIGFVYRDDESGELMISFESSNELEAGSRCLHLRGKKLPLQWSSIYLD